MGCDGAVDRSCTSPCGCRVPYTLSPCGSSSVPSDQPLTVDENVHTAIIRANETEARALEPFLLPPGC